MQLKAEAAWTRLETRPSRMVSFYHEYMYSCSKQRQFKSLCPLRTLTLLNCHIQTGSRQAKWTDYFKLLEDSAENAVILPKYFLSLESKDHVLSLTSSVKKSRSFVLSLNICDKYLICDILFLGNIANRDINKKIFWL